MRAWAALALVVAASAGCLGGDTATEDPLAAGDVRTPALDDGAMAGELRAPVPWHAGDFWTYENSNGEGGTFVVAADGGDHWVMMTTDEQTAWFDALTDLSFLGPQRKSDLAGSQGDDRVLYYQWPLTPGRTWTTPWDGIEQQITVLSVDGTTARLEARDGDVLRVEYAYDASVGWTSEMTFHNENGTEFRSHVTDHGSGFTGELVRWSIDADVDASVPLGPAAARSFAFDVPEGSTDIYLLGAASCPSGALAFGFGPTNPEAGWGIAEPCPFEELWNRPVVTSPEPGAWDGGVIASSPLGEGTFEARILVRTLERLAAPG